VVREKISRGTRQKKKLLKVFFWLALNKETKSSYRHGTAFLLSLIALFSLLSKIEVGLSNTSLSGCLCPPLITFEPIGGLS
jgi:predicted membrane channel-forming protein YqfA (hemolysin III family)